MRTRSTTNSKKKKVVQQRRKQSTKHRKRDRPTSLGTLGSKCIDVEINRDKHYALRRGTGKSKTDDNENKTTKSNKKSKRKQMINVFRPKRKRSSTNNDNDDSTFVGDSSIDSTPTSYNSMSKKKLNTRSLIDHKTSNKARHLKRIKGKKKDNDDALTVSIAMSNNTDDSNTVSDTDNESGNTVIKDLALKGLHVKKKLQHCQ